MNTILNLLISALLLVAPLSAACASGSPAACGPAGYAGHEPTGACGVPQELACCQSEPVQEPDFGATRDRQAECVAWPAPSTLGYEHTVDLHGPCAGLRPSSARSVPPHLSLRAQRICLQV